MFDKWKIKQVLCKVHKIYRKKAESFLYSNLYTHEEYRQLQDIQYAIAYVLCEYFDFNYEFYYNYFSYSYKWYIAYDYIQHPNLCKKAYENFVKENNTNHNEVIYIANLFNLKNWDIGRKALNTLSQEKGTIIHDVSTQRMYVSDGKKFIEMC